MKKYIITLLLIAGMSLTHSATTDISFNNEQCQQDFNFIAKFLLENDAGIHADGWKTYPDIISKTLQTQQTKITQITTIKDCVEIIEPFLRTIRKGHLWASDQSIFHDFHLNTDSNTDKKPIETQQLSELTTYIKVTSFREGMKGKLEKVIQSNQDNIRSSPYIIIDVRESNGGNDSNYLPLIQLLGQHEYWFQSPKLFSTPENIKAWTIYKTLLNSASHNKWNDAITAKMRTQLWRWVSLFDRNEIKQTIHKQEAWAQPKKVAILMSSECGSSCEQFILTVKQHPNVITMGQNSYGAIAASNMLEKLTPSNKIYLSYTGTYVNLGIQDVDRLGIPPQIKLTQPRDKIAYDAEVSLAQSLLENEKAYKTN
ncbi:hypothetical protein F889_01794 [Acinetobacter colistiniresistens]|uniref:Tail specific protease domain-containing protein n=1 Tax=Acinetobacter colistiniresistens TaxID=280145 RepID=N9R5V2_9GAMM|nr:S41 family peptidase [Acinetobacter colistiniresistens]ENX34512.1 hypothetical protein F889_01794 [Acinetobacter colistiniresistens]